MSERNKQEQLDPNDYLQALTEQVYVCIRDYIVEKGYPPSVADIAKRAHLSRSGVVRHLDRLEAQGRIKRDFRIPRGIALVEEEDGQGEI